MSKRKRNISRSTAQTISPRGGQTTVIPSNTWGANAPAFLPGAPMYPLMIEETPRVFDYPPGINIFLNPRETYGLLPYSVLRSLASMSDAIRIVIESIKREIRGLDWAIRAEDDGGDVDYTPEIMRLTKFWRRPDGVDTFDTWMNRFLTDMLVMDAPCLWINQTEGGEITSVDVIDGSTIRPLMDERGKLPLPPVPAYVQMIKGIPAQWFTADRLIFRPYNTVTNNPYGYSPIEWLVVRINEALRRQLSHAEYWKSTNVPEGIVALPDTWTSDQIGTFQKYWDTIVTGNTAEQRRIRFVPSAGSGNSVYEFKRPDATAQTAFDEFLIRVASWAYGFSPAELGIVGGSGGLGGKGFMEGGENAQMRLGLAPMTQYLSSIITDIVRRQTSAPLAFEFTNMGPEEDTKQELENWQIKMRNGAVDLNDWRKAEGKGPLPDVEPFMVIGSQVVLVRDIFAPKPPPQPQPPQLAAGQLLPDGVTGNNGDEVAAPLGEDAIKKNEVEVDRMAASLVGFGLTHWREKVMRRIADNKKPVCEPTEMASRVVPVALQRVVKTGLREAKDAQAVNELFRMVKGKQPTAARVLGEEKMRDGLAQLLAEQAKVCEVTSKEHALALTHDTDKFWVQFSEAMKAYFKGALYECALVGVGEARNEQPIARGYSYNLPPFAPGVDWTLVNLNAQHWAETYAAQLVAGISKTTRKKIADAVAQWIANGDALPELESMIDGVIDDPMRAFVIAITESTRAYAQGNTIAWKAKGVQGRRWYTAEDEIVCPLCGGTLRGQVAPIGHSFSDGVDNPPAHVGCRCYLQPVLDMDDQE